MSVKAKKGSLATRGSKTASPNVTSRTPDKVRVSKDRFNKGGSAAPRV